MAELLILDVLETLELVLITLDELEMLELVLEGSTELLVEEGALDDEEKTEELVDAVIEGIDEDDESEEDVEDTSDELDGAAELVDVMLQDMLEMTAGAQYWEMTLTLFIVTLPRRPNKEPYTVEAVFAVTEIAARTCPCKVVATPSVADEPTSQ